MHFFGIFLVPLQQRPGRHGPCFSMRFGPSVGPNSQQSGQDGDLQQPACSGLGVMFRGHLIVFEKMIPDFRF